MMSKLRSTRLGNLGVLELNRPEALHALTLDMVQGLQEVLNDYAHSRSCSTVSGDNKIRAVLFKSSECKRPAFCAGGDVKSVYETGKVYAAAAAAAADPARFFWEEYQVNHAIATATEVPFISFWDGVVMGGGVGLSIHGSYRIATENTLLAMPETAIGLFPDVGSMWWMPRKLPSRSMANYLALSGQRLNAADLLHVGLATHYVPSKQLPALVAALVEATKTAVPKNNDTTGTTGAIASSTNHDVVESVLSSFDESRSPKQNDNADVTSCFLQTHEVAIERIFQSDSIEAIMGRLQEEQDTDFGTSTLAKLKKMSPTSLKVTLEGLNRGAQCQTIGEDLQMEYRMARACVLSTDTDFYEGIRAVLVDKDHAPKWNPSKIEEVTTEMVQRHFEPIEDEWPIPKSRL